MINISDFMSELHMTTEAIAPQLTDTFKEDLADIIVKTLGDITDSTLNYDTELKTILSSTQTNALSGMEDELDAVVYKRLGIPTLTHIIPGSCNAYMFPTVNEGYDQLASDNTTRSDIDLKSMNNEMRNATKVLSKSMNMGKLKINDKKAYIKGLPSDKTFVVGLGALLFQSGLTPMEIVSIYVHEIGHHYTYIANASRFVKDDITLTDELMKITKSKKDDVYKEYAIAIAKSTGKEAEAEVSEALKKGEHVKATLSLIKHVLGGRNNELGEIVPRVIPGRSSMMPEYEVVADDFSIKFGLGTYVISALAKIVPHITHLDKDLNESLGFASVVTYAVTGTLISYYMFMALLLFPSALVFMLILPVNAYLAILIHNLPTDYTSTPERSMRVKRNLIRFLKDGTVPPSYKDTILIHIERLNRHLEGMEIVNTNPILTGISKLLVPGLSKEKMNVEFFQLLEDLNANELYYMAAKVKQI